MKKNIRSLLALLLCFILSISLGACSSENPEEIPENEESDTTEEKTSEKDEDVSIEISGEDATVADEEISTDDTDTDIQNEQITETNLGSEVEIFLSDIYYLEGTIYQDGESMAVKLATDGKNLQYTTDMDTGYKTISFGIAVLDNVSYVVLPDEKIYAELTQSLMSMLGLEDYNLSDFGITANDSDEQYDITQTEVTINGEAGICTTCTFVDATVKLYSVDDKLVQIDSFDTNGVRTTIIEVDSISAQIPSDQLTLNGLRKTDTSSFFAALISASA